MVRFQRFFFFFFFSKVSCSIREDKARELISETLIKSKIKGSLDPFDNFWDNFNAQNKSLKKKVAFYEIASINNENMVTTEVNPKEYFEKQKDFNEKHKDIKKCAWYEF